MRLAITDSNKPDNLWSPNDLYNSDYSCYCDKASSTGTAEL